MESINIRGALTLFSHPASNSEEPSVIGSGYSRRIDMKSEHRFLGRIGICNLVLIFFSTLTLLNSFTVPAQSQGALAEGTLIRQRGTPWTYVIQIGKKCYIPDAETFQSRGYQWSQVIEVDKATLDSIVTGLPLASVRPPSAQYTPPGTSVTTPPSSYPTTSPSSYPTTPPSSYPTTPPSSYPTTPPSSYSTTPPSSYPTTPPSSYPTTPPSGTSSYPSSSSSYPEASSSVFPDGTLVKGSGPQIYLIQNSRRCLIRDLGMLKNLELNQSSVVIIDDAALNRIPLGNPIYKR